MKLSKIFLFFCLLMVSACNIRDTETGRATHDFYFGYINTPTELNLNDADKLKAMETKLSNKFALLDKELSDLARTLESISDPTNRQVVTDMLNRFPWISNAFVINAGAEIAGALPPRVPVYIDFSYLNLYEEIKARELYGNILSDQDHKTFLVARPYIRNGDLIGYLAVSFEVEALLPLIGDSSNVFIKTPEEILFSGNNFNVVQQITNDQWNKQIDLRSIGHRALDNEHAAWVVRYYAKLPLIFGIVSEFVYQVETGHNATEQISQEQ